MTLEWKIYIYPRLSLYIENRGRHNHSNEVLHQRVRSRSVASWGPRYRLQCWYMAYIGSFIHALHAPDHAFASYFFTRCPIRCITAAWFRISVGRCTLIHILYIQTHWFSIYIEWTRGGSLSLLHAPVLPLRFRSIVRAVLFCRKPKPPTHVILSYYKAPPISLPLSHTCRHALRFFIRPTLMAYGIKKTRGCRIEWTIHLLLFFMYFVFIILLFFLFTLWWRVKILYM